MTKEELISKIRSLDRKVLREEYFDKLDDLIKEDKGLLEDLVNRAHFPIIASGGFADALKANGFNVAVSVKGSIRGSRKIDLSSYKDKINGATFTFIDDSFYAGRTLRKILNEVVKHGGRIEEVYVGYNDNPTAGFVNGIITKEDLR